METLKYFFCLCLTLAPSIQANPAATPSIEVSAEELTIAAGDSASVTCTPEGNPLPSVRWMKAEGEFGVGTKISGNTLSIGDAQDSDRGYYVCVAVLGDTDVAQKYVYVDIENPSAQSNLKVIVSQRTLLIPLGGQGTIECTPEGTPLPQIQWIKSDGEFREGISQSGNTLIISDARKEDRGHYVCQGIVDGSVTLTNYTAIEIDTNSATAALQKSEVSVSVERLTIPVGESGSITCNPGGNPPPSIQWRKHEGEFGAGTNVIGNTLTITDAQEGDQGYYLCVGVVSNAVVAQKYVNVEITNTDTQPTAVEIGSNEGTPDQFLKPVDVVISEGSDSRISCDFVTGDLEQKVTWTRRDQRPLPQNAQVVGQELVIQRATKEDSGEYLCKVTASRGGFLLRVGYVRLEVIALPVVAVHPPAQTVIRGEVVTIECVVDGDAQVTWDRVDGSLSSRVENQGSKLYFSGIELEDAGYYRCSAENKAGTSSGFSQVTVNDVELPGYLKLIVSQRQVIVPKGGSGSIECTPEGNPLPRVQWIKSNGEFRDGIRQIGNTLIISDAREEDRGHYACEGIVAGTVMLTNYTAVDVRDEPQTAPPANLRSPKVVVSQKQLTISPGDSVSIECTAEGNPLPSVQWTKSNGEFRVGITQNGNTLTISDARKEDEGHYVCQGIADGTVIATDFSAVYIQSEERPPAVAAGYPRVQVNVRQLKIPKGGNRTVECTPEGNPLPTTQWSKHEGAFGVGTRQNGNTLIISDAQEQDGGYYVCDGVVDGTAAWTDYLAVEIESNEPISHSQSLTYPRVTVSVRQLKIPRGGTIAIECTPEGSPLPTIQWSKDEGNFGVGTRQSGNSLLISDAQEEDRGNYVCSAIVDGDSVFSDYLTVEIQYICELPQDTGSCRAAFHRWYYDTAQQKCQKFIWGGCGGNKNNFETEEQCSLECERMHPTIAA